MNARLTPPRRAAALLAAFLPYERRDDLLADLDEEFSALAVAKGVTAARRWYVAQIYRSLLPVIARWLRLEVAEPAARAATPSIGGLFFMMTVLWIVSVVWVMPLDLTSRKPSMTQPDALHATIVRLEDGSVHLIYPLSDRDATEDQYSAQDREMQALMRLSTVALAPPAAAAILLFLLLSIADARRSSRLSEAQN